MSDLIKLHNEMMSVQQKLLECERALNSPVDCEQHLDAKVNSMLSQIVGVCSPQSAGSLVKNISKDPLVSPQNSSNSNASSAPVPKT